MILSFHFRKFDHFSDIIDKIALSDVISVLACQEIRRVRRNPSVH